MGLPADRAKATGDARPLQGASDLRQARFLPGNQHSLSPLAEATDSRQRLAQSTPAKQDEDILRGIRYLSATPVESAAATGRVTMIVDRRMTRICRRSCALRKDPALIAPTRI